MKIALFTFLTFLAALVLFIESSYGAKTVQYFLVQALQKSDLPVEIGHMEGRLPSKIRIERLVAGPIDADWVEFRLSLFSLLRGRIEIEELQGEGIRWDSSRLRANSFKVPLTLTIDSFSLKNVHGVDLLGRVTLYRTGGGKGKVFVSKSGCKDLDAEANGSWSKEGVVEVAFHANVPEIRCFFPSLQGSFETRGRVDGTLKNWRGHIDGNYEESIRFSSALKGSYKNVTFNNLEIVAPNASIASTLSIEPTQDQTLLHVQLQSLKSKYGKQEGTFEGKYLNEALSGDLFLQGTFHDEGWTLQTPLFYRTGGALNLSKVEIRSSSLEANGEIALRPDRIWIGSLAWDKGDLSLLSYGGMTQGKIDFSAEENMQVIELTAKAQELYVHEVYAKQADITGRYAEEEGNVALALEGLHWKDLSLQTGSLRFRWDRCTATPFCLYGLGDFKGPLEIQAGGQWDMASKLLRLEWARGTLFGMPMDSKNEVVFQWNEQRAAIENLNVTLGEATIVADYVGQKEGSRAALEIKKLPLGLGTLEFTGNMVDEQGDFHLSLPAGTVDGKIAPHHLSFQTEGLAKGWLKIPVEIRLWPPRVQFRPDGSINGAFQYAGTIEDLLDPFDLGSHYIEGPCKADLEISGKLPNPEIHGFFRIEDGGYQNYWSGTELRQVKLDLEAHGDQIALRSFSANNGAIEGKGSVLIDFSQHLPYQVDLHLHELPLTEIDLVRIYATGNAELQGTWKRGKITGNIELDQATLTIPDRITKQLPNLQVVYKNGTQMAEAVPKPSIYPIDLELNVDVRKNLLIEGRGLKSDWSGNFVVGGTIDDPSAKGKIELIDGEFVFSSRHFKLTDGSVSMDGLADHMPQINLAGVWAEKGISIMVRLRGPLNEPQITFQSTPPLPLNGILSYLLFGQDISEITAFQALQLVNSAATISGSSPDILETTRKSLGVDRLRIVSRPALGDGEDSIALQVGQYVAEGVIISVSQGAEQSSTNISIEVDLSQGFVFQAETIQEEEQGKFTIKWNRNY